LILWRSHIDDFNQSPWRNPEFMLSVDVAERARDDERMGELRIAGVIQRYCSCNSALARSHRIANCRGRRLKREFKRRSRLATFFSNEALLLRQLTAVLMEIGEELESQIKLLPGARVRSAKLSITHKFYAEFDA
jgi:hypothetical protein